MSLFEKIEELEFFDAEKSEEKNGENGFEPKGILLLEEKGEIKELVQEQNKKLEQLQEAIKANCDLLRQIFKRFDKEHEDSKELFSSVEAGLKEISNKLDEVLKEDLRREMFMNLKEEKKRFREDWEYRQKKRAIKKTIHIHDTLQALPPKQELSPLKGEIMSVLRSLGIEKIEKRPEYLNSEFQEVIDTRRTQFQEEDMKVVEVKKEGFRYLDNRVVRPMRVKVKRYEEG